jgi:hypothetical protein
LRSRGQYCSSSLFCENFRKASIAGSACIKRVLSRRSPILSDGQRTTAEVQLGFTGLDFGGDVACSCNNSLRNNNPDASLHLRHPDWLTF